MKRKKSSPLFQRFFSNPISKYLISKEFHAFAVWGYLPKLTKFTQIGMPGGAFGAH